MQPTQDQIQELRRLFLQKIEDDRASIPEGFHPVDIERVKNSDDWVRRFLEHTDLNMTESLQMMWDTCEWRKKFGTNDISESNVKLDYLIEGSFFTRNKDKDGCSLFIFKCKKHVKGQRDIDELKRCVVYWFERLERQDKGRQLTLFFDMADTGLSNMDMEFTKYLIGLFKQYYPNFLNYILIFEMPWVLNAAFKVIKSWLPAKAVQKIKFVNKSNLKDYVTTDQALACWGGQDNYTFSFIPESKDTDPVLNTSTNKKVHFADGTSITDDMQKDGGNSPDGSLSISPSEIITFVKDGNELNGSFTLTNVTKIILSYKIKTTSPEKFRVRPSTGCLTPGSQCVVNVTLQPGFQLGGLSKDKFLVMNTPIQTSEMTAQEISELWKNTSDKIVEQHRLKCTGPQMELPRNGSIVGSGASESSGNQLARLVNTVDKIGECQAQLHKSVKRIQIYQFLIMILIIILAIAVVYIIRIEIKESSAQSCYSRL